MTESDLEDDKNINLS